MKTILKCVCLTGLLSLVLLFSESAISALPKGIYLSQPTLENTEYLRYLIRRAKAAGITTFVIDMEKPSKLYQRNIELVKANNIHYVARVTIFPGGGTPEQVASIPYREKKLKLVQAAVGYGAQQIQLDYIRYNTKTRSPDHAKNIYAVIRWFKDRIPSNVPLQIDVFGISAFGESQWIGQNIKMFSSTVDAICPMVYPSHYEPYRVHAVKPYETVHDSLVAIKGQFKNNMPVKLYPYLELSNYRYPLSHDKKIAYIRAQIKATEDAGADGWYAWSANNLYDNLFNILENHQVK